MSKKVLIIFVLLVLIVLFGYWVRQRLTTQDISFRIVESGEVKEDILRELEGRRLVWNSSANVPLKIEFGGRGHDVWDIIGVPEQWRPFSFKIGRNPIRNEANVTEIVFGENGEMSEPVFLTENNVYFFNQKQVTPDGPIVATHSTDRDEDVVIIRPGMNNFEIVSETMSLDRWPSINRDGNLIVFHSYRDRNPGGDLYLAELNEVTGEWDPYRLTDNPDVEFQLPMIDPSGKYAVAVERDILIQDGRAVLEYGLIILWELENRELKNPRYITSVPYKIISPSISENGEVIVWADVDSDIQLVRIWTEEDGERVLGPDGNEMFQGQEWYLPSVSPDGRFITFIESALRPGDYYISIYDLESGEILHLEGCGNHYGFPSLSEPGT